jgi:hypothetical protein
MFLQILSLRVYETAIRGLWAPPLHTAISGMQQFLMPYLQPQQPQEGQGERMLCLVGRTHARRSKRTLIISRGKQHKFLLFY